MLRGCLGVVVAVALVTATGAGSRPAAGITVTAKEPVTAIIGGADPTGVYQLAIVVAAKFSPEALHDDARVTFISVKPNGLGASPFTGYDQGNVLHTTAVYQNVWAAFEGDRILVAVKWNAYTPQVGGTVSGTATSSTVVQVPKREPAPRLVSDKKQRFAKYATVMYANCATAAIVGVYAAPIPPVALGALALAGLSCGAAMAFHRLALDPVDLGFRVVAKPKTPPAPKVTAGEGVSAAAAAALNTLFALQAKELGLAAAMVTAFNRSQGAHVKKQTVWEKRQVLAAGKYADQLSALMLAEAKLRPSVERALSSSAGPTADPAYDISEAEAYAFQSSLVNGSLPVRLAAGLSKLGLTKADMKEVRAQLVVRNHPTLYDGDAIAAIADPLHLSLLRRVAADLKGFAKDAARNPLETGT